MDPGSDVADYSEVHTLANGTRVLVRPILRSDREALAAGYDQLSEVSRRLRFFNAPEHLSDEQLDYLTNLDFENHFALGAFAIDELGQPGVGVARWVRCPDDPESAEAAVTVLDRYQGRGIGTLLLMLVARAAVERGVRRFVASVLWDNTQLLELLEQLGARISPEDPGVARIEIDLVAQPETERVGLLHRILQAASQWMDELRSEIAGGSPSASG